MSITHIVGVDPGLVHTGVVRFVFDSHDRTLVVSSEAVVGIKPAEVTYWIEKHDVLTRPEIFIEAYRPRSHFNNDKRMVEGVAEIRKYTKGKVLDNTGVKKVIRQPLMELLGCWKFSTVTNHQDLRSAARIALLGMVKDEGFNWLLADIVKDYLRGDAWAVTS